MSKTNLTPVMEVYCVNACRCTLGDWADERAKQHERADASAAFQFEPEISYHSFALHTVLSNRPWRPGNDTSAALG